MWMLRFTQAIVCAWLLAFAFVPAGEPDGGATPRQAELYREFLSLQPAGYDGPGPWMLDEWDTDSGLAELVGLPVGPGNAAAVFLRLEQLYDLEKAELQAGGADARGVALLLDAADMAECRLSPEYYPEFDRVASKQPDFVVMRSYLQALLKRGERAQAAGNGSEAERCYRAALLCGRHLTRDRSSALVYMTGVIFKLRGAQALEAHWRLSGRVGQAEAAKRYLNAISDVLRLLYWKANVGLGELDGFASLPCLVRVATGDKEQCWRKEAIARLAVLRHGVPDAEKKHLYRNPRFEQIAEEALSSVAAKDPDPSVRRFAVWAALNVRPEMYDELAHTFE